MSVTCAESSTHDVTALPQDENPKYESHQESLPTSQQHARRRQDEFYFSALNGGISKTDDDENSKKEDTRQRAQQESCSSSSSFLPQHYQTARSLEESYPTPIISNRGLLEPRPGILLPLQLPPPVTALASGTSTATSASSSSLSQQQPQQHHGEDEHSSLAHSTTARFSSFEEPAIQCSWPSTMTTSTTHSSHHHGWSSPGKNNGSGTTSTRVPPEISIPMSRVNDDDAIDRAGRTTTHTSMRSTHLYPVLPPVMDWGVWVRLMWHIIRAAHQSGKEGGTLLGWPRLGVGGAATEIDTIDATRASTFTRRNKLRTLIHPLGMMTSTTTIAPPCTTATLVGDGTVHGLPSFGQTCFMNATLQSLASLEAFVVYLQHIVYLTEQTKHFPSWSMAYSHNEDTSSSHWDHRRHETSIYHNNNTKSNNEVSRLLLDCLQRVNGSVAMSSSSVIDTRPLLRAIGSRHKQFRTMGSEQQDAQEFLTVLLDSVVSEGGITSPSFVYPNSFVSLPEPTNALTLLWEDEQEDVLTVVSGYKERHKTETSKNENHSPNSLSIPNPNDNHTNTTTTPASSSSFEYSTGDHQLASNHSGNESAADDQQYRQRHYHNGVYVRPEEKKQEDFELHIPKVASEEELSKRFQAPPVHHVMDQSHIGVCVDDPSLSDVSSKGRQQLSTSLEIMRTTTTSLSPSPLTGWMGSSLQCRRCGHVRPIRNHPFGDWSVAPTAIADGWLRGGDKNHGTRPCHLEDCLADYVRVERVDDVECRSCTLQHEREKMVEEIEMTEGAIAGLIAKAKRQGNLTQMKSDSSCKALCEELYAYRCELLRLQRIDTDDDDQPIFTVPDNGADDNGTMPPLLRASARKCMFLTRLPAILCVHVQRRFYNPHCDSMTKITQHVIFPEILDVSPYCAYGGVMGGNWAGSQRGSGGTNRTTTARGGTPKSIPYKLQAVMEHRGGAFSGHYVCYRRDKSNGGWLYISDHLVRRVSWGEVQRCQAYMLFYEAAMSDIPSDLCH